MHKASDNCLDEQHLMMYVIVPMSSAQLPAATFTGQRKFAVSGPLTWYNCLQLQ